MTESWDSERVGRGVLTAPRRADANERRAEDSAPYPSPYPALDFTALPRHAPAP